MTVKIAVMLLTVCASLNADATTRPVAEPRPSNRLTGLGEYEVPPPPRILPNLPPPDELSARGVAAECTGNLPLLDDAVTLAETMATFEPGRYVPPVRVAGALHEIGRQSEIIGPTCEDSIGARLKQYRKRALDTLEESLDKDSFVLEGSLAVFERKFDDLERRVAAAESAGWPEGSKGRLATEYAGYHQGQADELVQQYLYVLRGLSEGAEAAGKDATRHWLDARYSDAVRKLARLTPRITGLEVKLDIGINMPGATPYLPGRPAPTPGLRLDPGAGPVFGHKAFDGDLPTFDGGARFVTGGASKDIRTPPVELEIPRPRGPSGYTSPKPRGWMR